MPCTPAKSKNSKSSQNAKKTIPRGENESPFKQKSEKMKKVADIRTFFESRNSASKSNENQKLPKNFYHNYGSPLQLENTAKTYTSNAGRPPSHWRLLCEKNAQGGAHELSAKGGKNGLGKPSEKNTAQSDSHKTN